MKTLTIKNVPDELHACLARLAADSHRSLNGEVIARLKESVEKQNFRDPDEILRQIDEHREKMGGPIWTTDDIEAAINEGHE